MNDAMPEKTRPDAGDLAAWRGADDDAVTLDEARAADARPGAAARCRADAASCFDGGSDVARTWRPRRSACSNAASSYPSGTGTRSRARRAGRAPGTLPAVPRAVDRGVNLDNRRSGERSRRGAVIPQ